MCMVYQRNPQKYKTTKDVNCIGNYKFLCQFDPCKSISANDSRVCPDTSAHSKPPNGYVYVAQTEKYYRPYKISEQFLDALEVCQAEGGTIIEFRTPEEHNVLNQMQSEKNH